MKKNSIKCSIAAALMVEAKNLSEDVKEKFLAPTFGAIGKLPASHLINRLNLPQVIECGKEGILDKYWVLR